MMMGHWIWTLVGVLLAIFLVILIVRALRK